MDRLDPQKDGSSKDIVQENIQRLKVLFPEAFSEDKVDFSKLQQVLGEYIEDKEERYNFTWYGKSQARRIAQTPSTGTLRPCKEESKDWETTQNLFIEGDNLEVLKLLQKSYHKKVKMIYIDPPYNTGGEFIYPDNYRDNLDTYLAYSGQKDDEGYKFSSNAEQSGRYHTNWLNMMYPRLKLARNLLRDDGAIFISIDDNEASNLKKICDELFGEENLLGIISVISNLKGRSDDKYFATAHNYLLAYQKSNFDTLGVPLPEEYLKDYKFTDSNNRRYRLQGLRKRGSGARRQDRPNMYFPIYVDSKSKKVSLEKDALHDQEVYPRLSDGSDGRWRWGKETVRNRVDELTGGEVGADKRWDIFQIDYADSEDGAKRIKPKSIWMGPEFANEAGTLEVKNLLGKDIFDTPKPTALIEYCLEQCINSDSIILDFFSGSCTSAHATMRFSKRTGFRVNHISIQLPEPCGENSVAFEAGYTTIAEIGKERIRRAGEKLLSEDGEKGDVQNLDIGVKVFKLDSSNIKPWAADFENLQKSIDDAISNIKSDRSEGDVLYELLLKYGLDLTLPIEKRTIAGKAVYSIGMGALVICLDSHITLDVVEGIGRLKEELEPEIMRVVFRDSGFKDDVVKTNAVQILKQYDVVDVKSL